MMPLRPNGNYEQTFEDFDIQKTLDETPDGMILVITKVVYTQANGNIVTHVNPYYMWYNALG